MKKNTKHLILKKAYLLFLEKGYDGVSISALQNKLGIGRATMYHHFASKKELFKAVIEMNFIAMQDSQDLSEFQNIILSEYLIMRIKKAREAIKRTKLPKKIGMLNFFILSFQALGHFPEYTEKSFALHEHELAKWKIIIRNSMNKGEVRKEIDVEQTTRLFMDARHGIGVTSTFNTTMEDSITEIEQMYQFVFSLIKA